MSPSTFDDKQLTAKAEGENNADIPAAVFIEDVENFVGRHEPMVVHAALRELLNKYNFMFESMLVQKRSTLRKLPDIQQAIEVVDFLKRRCDKGEMIMTHFPLTDNCHARTEIPPSEKVCLWLGANVMLEYSIAEAEELLRTSNANASETMKKLDENMAFLRDQITTTEVNIARVHNYMVKIKAQLRAIEASGPTAIASA